MIEQVDVLIVGAGPTGLAAALFLADRGNSCRIIDKAASPAAVSRAQLINPRTLELLDSVGIAAQLVNEARPVHGVAFYQGWDRVAGLEFGDAHPTFRMSVLPQSRIEAVMTDALARRGIVPERRLELEKFVQGDRGVDCVLQRPGHQRETVRASLLFGADGAHSQVRKGMGVAFIGSDFPEEWPLYDIRLEHCPLDASLAHISFVEGGLVFLLCIRDGVWRLFGDVPGLLGRLPPGTRAGEPVWQSAFHIAHRMAEHEVDRRVVIGGDAAHIHSPVAARGMNLGIEDAYVFAACAADALKGDLGRLSDYGRIRQVAHRQVVNEVERLTQLARGRPGVVGIFRQMFVPFMTAFPPTARAMKNLVTGLDHDVQVT
jgi:2-polyprenyl-6-methoxyphenol hydroxylase-like FAD-dependent oxidoreductase